MLARIVEALAAGGGARDMEAAVLLSSALDANALPAPDHLESCGRCLLAVVSALGRCGGLTPTAVANLLAPFDCCELRPRHMIIGSLKQRQGAGSALFGGDPANAK